MFWLQLEYSFPDPVLTVEGIEMRGTWCDGFIPEEIRDTQYGVIVRGEAWIVQGRHRWMDCDFVVHVPQKLLYQTIQDFSFSIDTFDPNEKFIELTVCLPGVREAEPCDSDNRPYPLRFDTVDET